MVETVTVNYGWTKPEITKSASTWGGFLNTDLDSIDAQVKINENAVATINARFTPNYLNLVRGSDGGTAASIFFYNQTGTNVRWALYEDTTSETGANAGSNFGLSAFNDTGAFLSTPISINRATGKATFGQVGCASLAVTGAITGASLAVTGAITCNSISATTSINVPSITSPTVNATTVNATGLITGNNLTASNGFVNIRKGSATNPTLFLNDNVSNRSAFFFDVSSNQTVVQDLASGAQLTLDGVGNFHFNGTANAYKAGGGSWSAPSDARIKTVTGEYASGLNEVLQLNPVIYVYKGNETRTASVAGTSFIGLVADEVLSVMPEMVSLSDAVINGVEVNDFKSLDTTPLLFALVNAVRELKAEIEALKAR